MTTKQDIRRLRIEKGYRDVMLLDPLGERKLCQLDLKPEIEMRFLAGEIIHVLGPDPVKTRFWQSSNVTSFPTVSFALHSHFWRSTDKGGRQFLGIQMLSIEGQELMSEAFRGEDFIHTSDAKQIAADFAIYVLSALEQTPRTKGRQL